MKLSWQRLTAASWQAMLAELEQVESDIFGPKVLRAASGHYLKVFRIKRLLSSGRLVNPAKRFCDNAQALTERGIATITPLALYDIPAQRRYAVYYQPLPGSTVRELLARGALSPLLIEQLAAFIYGLHQQGVYFRSLHPGNVVVTPGGKFGLIDVLDLRFRWFGRPLSRGQVARNFRHFLRYEDGRQIEQALMAAYRERAGQGF